MVGSWANTFLPVTHTRTHWKTAIEMGIKKCVLMCVSVSMRIQGLTDDCTATPAAALAFSTSVCLLLTYLHSHFRALNRYEAFVWITAPTLCGCYQSVRRQDYTTNVQQTITAFVSRERSLEVVTCALCQIKYRGRLSPHVKKNIYRRLINCALPLTFLIKFTKWQEQAAPRESSQWRGCGFGVCVARKL